MKRLNTVLMLLALAAISIFALGGCSSDDGVTPNEEPEITAEDAAYQAGFITVAMARVLQDMTTKQPVIRTINQDHVYGSYWDDGEADRVWTDGGDNVLYVDFDGVPHDMAVDSQVNFDINDATPGLANGTGSVEFTPTVTFNIVNVVLDPGNFPVGGQVLVDTSGHTATITFFAGHLATVQVGEDVWDVDMDTGEIEPA